MGEDGHIKEEWISFVEIDGTDAETLVLFIVNELERLQLPLNLCIGTAFDGAANMSGKKSGK